MPTWSWYGTTSGTRHPMVPERGDTVGRSSPADAVPGETLGARIARLRGLLGWTQQDLADRLAISRVAVSHLEMGLSVPSERTIVLLAGVFHLEPPELVERTAYPEAKAERLPPIAARYTEVELQVALLRRDLDWLGRLRDAPHAAPLVEQVLSGWRLRLADLAAQAIDPGERRLLAEARTTIGAEFAKIGHSARLTESPSAVAPRSDGR